MADPFLTLGRMLMLIVVPLMLLFPLAFAAVVPGRAASGSARIGVRGRLLTLVLATLVLLGAWVGLLLTGLRFPGAMGIASFWWAWFFPLWFFLAWPVVARKRPDWGPGVLSLEWPGAASASASHVRTASLINRERRSPVTAWMWAVAALVALVVLAAIAARGLMPFPSVADRIATPSGQQEALRVNGGTEPWRLEEHGKSERSSWARALAVHAGVSLLLALALPPGLRRLLTESEPMNTTGAVELSRMYDQQRRRRALGLFWSWGVLLPGCIGTALALSVWFPNRDGMWGLIGGVGGALMGIGGAIFGTWVTVERSKIAEAKARLEQGAMAPR
jgi:hypothetical protein